MADNDLIDNTAEALEALKGASAEALEIIGGMIESYAKGLCPVDTGALRNSITHRADGKTVLVGSAIHYAPYVELGTGKEYEPPPEWMEAHGEKGRGLDRWFYQDEQGNWHTGYPQKPKPFLRPAVENHVDEYKRVMENELQNADE